MKSGLSVRVMPGRSSQMIWQLTRLFLGRPSLHIKPSSSREGDKVSDFQKQTLKKYGRNFLILCGFILLVYSMVKFELVRYAVLAVLTLIVVGGCAWALIRISRWDWWLRGRLNKDEYEAYMACDKDVLWSMYNKLNEEAQS